MKKIEIIVTPKVPCVIANCELCEAGSKGDLGALRLARGTREYKKLLLRQLFIAHINETTNNKELMKQVLLSP